MKVTIYLQNGVKIGPIYSPHPSYKLSQKDTGTQIRLGKGLSYGSFMTYDTIEIVDKIVAVYFEFNKTQE